MIGVVSIERGDAPAVLGLSKNATIVLVASASGMTRSVIFAVSPGASHRVAFEALGSWTFASPTSEPVRNAGWVMFASSTLWACSASVHATATGVVYTFRSISWIAT